MKRSLIVGGSLLVLCSVVPLAQTPATAKYPEIGVWKQNLEKSKYITGQPARMSVRKYETTADGFIVVTIAGLDSQGNPTFNMGRFKYDGKDYPVYPNTALLAFVATGAKLATNAYKIVDAYTGEFTSKDNTGKVTGTNTRVVSRDGKTLTATAKDATGKVTNVLVFDRQ